MVRVHSGLPYFSMRQVVNRHSCAVPCVAPPLYPSVGNFCFCCRRPQCGYDKCIQHAPDAHANRGPAFEATRAAMANRLITRLRSGQLPRDAADRASATTCWALDLRQNWKNGRPPAIKQIY